MAVPLRATYRLQLHKDFTFADALAQLPYLAKLGISHLYLSPILMSRAGSTHGYDGVDPGRIDPELGGEEGFAALVAGSRAHGLGIILDIVPNHLAVDALNPFWMEVLEFGQHAPAGKIFDIDWARGPVSLPSLGKTLEEALRDGEISLAAEWEAGRLTARYFDNAWPLRPESVAAFLQIAGPDSAPAQAVAAQFLALEGDTPPIVEAIDAARTALRGLDGTARAAVEKALAGADLAATLHRQNWRLLHWRAESDSLTYRRFFNITGLIGVRVEDETVFERIHARPLAMLRAGEIDGLRIDHIDGLADPTEYCDRLRQAAGPEAIILIEKILGDSEALRDWPITGTTGYERLNDINGLFVSPEGYHRLDDYLVSRGLLAPRIADRLAAAKSFLLRHSFVSEVEVLTDLAQRLAEGQPAAADFGRHSLREGLLALLIHFPVYRSYGADTATDAADRALWQQTLADLRASANPWAAAVASWLVGRLERTTGDIVATEFIRRFQQLSGPAMAKGLEDTEFYRSLALSSVNEVGGDLLKPWRDVAEFHAIQSRRAAEKRQDLIPLATHDTKRGPETRARINAISLWPEDWIQTFERWQKSNAVFAKRVNGAAAPDTIDEWLIYQTLLGTWPISIDRLREYLTKAMREAKRHSFWEQPNEAYEAAAQGFARALLEDRRAAAFRSEMDHAIAAIREAAEAQSLAQTALQLTLPGTPDIYQGTELWDHSLVDPDNRRPVDYAARAAMLDAPAALDLDGPDPDGRVKFTVTQRLLALRAREPALFRDGDYVPLTLPNDWLGFRRHHDGRSLLVIVPRRGAGTSLPPFRDLLGDRDKASAAVWLDCLTGEPTALKSRPRPRLPVVLLSPRHPPG